MDGGQGRRWLVGLRRAMVAGTALDRWIVDRGVTGAVWTPAGWEVEDAAVPLVRLVEAGAAPDASLLWDLAVEDVRAAAQALVTVYRDTDGGDGYVACWMHSDELVDPGRAAASAAAMVAEVGRPNVAVAFAWLPARAGALSAVVARGIPVAVAGGADVLEGARKAWEKGMERRRKEAEDDEEVEDVPVFLLGAEEEEGSLHGLALVSEIGLVSGRRLGTGTPGVPAAEQAQRARAIERLARRSRMQARDDAYADEAFASEVGTICSALDRDDVLEKLWAQDHTIFGEDPAEIADRLGWLWVPGDMRETADELASWAEDVRRGASAVVLCGMGGSSLAPETFRAVLEAELPLVVCDTTDPDHIRRLTDRIDASSALFVIASKSGTTAETRAQLEHFWARTGGAGDRFVAVTDPGTPLASLARERGFRRVFENPPDIGGRYSGLSLFGLVPAALCGIDIRALLDEALVMLRRNAPSVPAPWSPGCRLGAALGEAVSQGRDKLTLVLPDAIGPLGDWVEQLVAESTGKDGTGIVPVVGEPLGPPDVYADDRLFVAYAVDEEPFPEQLGALEEAGHPVVRLRAPWPAPVGAEMYRWMVATAVAGYEMDVNPFDQPDVEAAKARAREVLEGASAATPDRGDAGEVLEGAEPGTSYLAIQAFLPPSEDVARRLRAVRVKLRDRLRVATTVGFGPRFLHSTGQLHKGGPDTGLFLQVTGPHAHDVEIPGMPYTFGRLIDAQADGDLQALRDAGRRVARLSLEELEALA